MGCGRKEGTFSTVPKTGPNHAAPIFIMTNVAARTPAMLYVLASTSRPDRSREAG